MTGIDWTFDHVVALAGLVAALIAAVGGSIAAIFSVKGNSQAKAIAGTEAARRDRDIRPVPTFMPTGLQGGWVSNAGGAIQPGYVAVIFGNYLKGGQYTAGEHVGRSSEFRLVDLVAISVTHPIPFPAGTAIVHLARDVDGRWWDILTGSILEEDVPDPSGDAFKAWCEVMWRRALNLDLT